MNDFDLRKKVLTQGIRSLWLNWSLPTATIAASILVAPYLSKTVLPVFIFIEVFVLFRLIRDNRKRQAPYCFKIPYICALVMFWVATLMVVFNLLKFLHAENGLNGQPFNPSMPFFPVLLITPIGTIISAWYLSKKKRSFCRDCEARTGNSVERSFVSKIYTQEANYQNMFLFMMFIGIGVVEWAYYFIFYINININQTDRFFYIWLPTALYVLSLIYMGFRYYFLWSYYISHDPTEAKDDWGFTRLRYLIVCEDRVLLNVPANNQENVGLDDYYVDTPAKTSFSYRSHVNTIEAGEYFRLVTGIRGADIRFLYFSSDKRTFSNIFHFAAFINDFDAVKNSIITGEWLTVGDIQELHRMGLLSNYIEAEIDRIYKVVMAWKTYTPEGKRLYAIKHYRPTFRLSDMRNWEVDYNDPKWLYVSMFNEDKPFFKLRKLWNRYISGIGI